MDLGLQIQKTNVGVRISILQIPCVPIFTQNEQLRIFWPKFTQILDFGVWIPKSLSPDLELAPPRYYLCQFSVKMGNFEFFGPNFWKLPNYVRHFGSNNVEGVAES